MSLGFAGGNLFASNLIGDNAAQIASPFTGTGQADNAGCQQQEGIAEDSGGAGLFVACYGGGTNGHVAVLNPGTGVLVATVLVGTAGGTAPSGIAPDGTSGDVVVADAKAGTLATISATTKVGQVSLPSGSMPANVAYADPGAVNFDYVADPGTGQVSVVKESTDSSPSDVANVTLPAATNPSQPYGVATNGSNVLVVSDANNARALVYTLSSATPYLTLDYVIQLPATAVPDGVADITLGVGGTAVNAAFIGDEAGNTVSIVDPPIAASTTGSDIGPTGGSGGPVSPTAPVSVLPVGTQGGTPPGTLAPPSVGPDSNPLVPSAPTATHHPGKHKRTHARRHRRRRARHRRAARHRRSSGKRA